MRVFHDAKAEFITLNTRGSLETQKFDIPIGNPLQVYIIFYKNLVLLWNLLLLNRLAHVLLWIPEIFH